MIGEEPITRLHAWIAIHPDGSEGILSRDMPTPFGPRHMPLITGSLSVAEKMEVVAKLIQAEHARVGHKFGIVMRTYRQELG